MREFSKISPAVWRSTRFTSLASDDARFLYLYLLTNEHQNSAGAYRLPDGYACADLQWQLSRYVKAREALEQADLINFDEAVSVVMVKRWLRHNPPMNESHLKGIERVLERLESGLLADEVTGELEAAWESVQAEREAAANRKAGYRKPSDTTGTVTHLLGTRHMNGGGAR